MGDDQERFDELARALATGQVNQRDPVLHPATAWPRRLKVRLAIVRVTALLKADRPILLAVVAGLLAEGTLVVASGSPALFACLLT